MELTALHSDFGVEVRGVDLRDVSDTNLFAHVRALFEEHSLLVFRAQHLDDQEHLMFSRLFGPIEDRSNVRMDGPEKISYGVSNVDEDGVVFGDGGGDAAGALARGTDQGVGLKHAL